MSISANLKDTKLINKAISSLNPLFFSALDIMSQNIINWPETVYGFKELTASQIAVPVIEPGSPAIGVSSESVATKFYEPKPIEVNTYISASEIAKYKTYNKEEKQEWMSRKIDQHIRKAILQTKNSMAVSMLTTGTTSWKMRKQNGALDDYTIAVGSIAAPSVAGSWGTSTKFGVINDDLNIIEEAIQDSGYGANVEFYCGRTVFSVLTSLISAASNDKRFQGQVGPKTPGGAQSIILNGRRFINDPLRYYNSSGSIVDGISTKYILAIDKAAGHETINLPILNLNADLKPNPLWINIRDAVDGSGVFLEGKATPLYIPVCGAIKYVQVAA